jgi:hypothetical protein
VDIPGREDRAGREPGGRRGAGDARGDWADWSRATGVIGQQVHPRTGVLIVYVAAASAGRVDAVAAGPELSAVRWVGLAKAGEPMANLARHARYYP